MKTVCLALLCYLLPLSLFAQEGKPHKIDDSIQVFLPLDFKKVDTLGQTLITAETSFGHIQISKQPDNQRTTPNIEKLKHLNKYYDDFIKRIRTTSKHGIVSNVKDTFVGKLHAKDFTLEVDSGSGKQLRNFRILHENSATYTFQFLYQDISKEYALPESDKFFKSITLLAPADMESQFTKAGTTTGKAPTNNNKLYMWVGASLLFLAGLFLFLRKRQGSSY